MGAEKQSIYFEALDQLPQNGAIWLHRCAFVQNRGLPADKGRVDDIRMPDDQPMSLMQKKVSIGRESNTYSNEAANATA